MPNGTNIGGLIKENGNLSYGRTTLGKTKSKARLWA